MLISTSIPSLLNGISQQPPAQRFPTQAEDQVNAYSSVVDGLIKRPCTEFIADLGASALSGVSDHIHAIKRDAVERYMVVISSSGIKVYDTAGASKTVNAPDGYSYLSPAAGTTFPNSIKCVTIGDYTFILNRTKTVAMDTTLTSARNPEALVAIINGAYHTNYTIKVGASTYSITTGGSSADGDCVEIAIDLAAAYNAAPISGVSVTRTGHILHFASSSSTDFTISVEDGLGGAGTLLVKKSVQAFTDLPTIAPTGMKVKVEGIPGEREDDYYVEFTANAGSGTGEGVWRESLAEGVKYKFDYATMPHALIRLSNGQFVFKRVNGTAYSSFAGTNASWAERTVGDDVSNPLPSFVGFKINDIFLFKDRLGFLANESVIMSETSEYFNPWRTTVTQIIDSDPIDIQSAFPQVSILRAAVPINDRLIVFSDKAQFIVQGTQVVTPNSVSMTAATQYEMDPTVTPVAAGNSVFFATNRNGTQGIREFIQSENDPNLFDAPDVTANVPKLLPYGIKALAFNSMEGCLIVVPSVSRTSVNVYKFFGAGSQRIQSSWSRYQMSNQVIGADFFDNQMYLISYTSGDTTATMERMDFGPDQKDLAKSSSTVFAAYKTLLDCRADETACTISYSSATDLTTVTLPFTPRPDRNVVIVSRLAVVGGAETIYGEVFYKGKPTTRTFTVPGKLESTVGTVAVYVGFDYEMLYEFSEVQLRVTNRTRGTSDTVTSGRLQVRYCTVLYANSGYFKAKVMPDYGAESISEWTGNDVGTGNAIIGKMSVSDGRFKFPVYGLNTEVRVQLLNDTFLPCAFLNAEFECLYKTRSQRV